MQGHKVAYAYRLRYYNADKKHPVTKNIYNSDKTKHPVTTNMYNLYKTKHPVIKEYIPTMYSLKCHTQ